MQKPIDVIKMLDEIEAEYLSTATKRQTKQYWRRMRRAEKQVDKDLATAHNTEK